MKARTPELNRPPVLYVNGLERVDIGIPERSMIAYLKLRGISSTHAEIDWHTHNFADIRQNLTMQVSEKLKEYGRLALVASSAGVSLSATVFKELRRENPDTDLCLLGFSGWTRIHDLEQLQRTALSRPGKRPSEAFVDSVIHFDENSSKKLTTADKQRMHLSASRGDTTVPFEATGIDGVITHEVQGDHVGSIVRAALQIPQTLDDLYADLAV